MQFTQNGDSNDGEFQMLDIKIEDAGAGKFFVLETTRWAFDEPKDLLKLLEKAAKAFEVEEQK